MCLFSNFLLLVSSTSEVDDRARGSRLIRSARTAYQQLAIFVHRGCAQKRARVSISALCPIVARAQKHSCRRTLSALVSARCSTLFVLVKRAAAMRPRAADGATAPRAAEEQ